MASSQNQNHEAGRSRPLHDTPGLLDQSAEGEHRTHPTDLPELSTLLPAIFVPLEQDFLKPIEPARDRIDLLQRMQHSLDANEKAVRGNLIWTFEREARRSLNEANRKGSLAVPHKPKEITWNEGDKLLANMAAPANPNQAYHLSLAALEEFRASPVNTGLEHLSSHERVARDMLIVVHKGSQDIEGYSKRHIKEIRDRLSASLGKEKEDDQDHRMRLS